jgi:LysM domain
VKPNDTLWDLAAGHLGDAHRWSQLFDLNRGRPEPGGRLVDPNLIYVGWTLRFPDGATGLTLETAPHRQIDRVYVVQAGDTLWDLAATHLGSPYRWVQLFNLNRGRLEPGGRLVDPGLIYAGWTLEFPAGAIGLAAVGAATHPAGGQGLERRALPATTLVAYLGLKRLGQQAIDGVSGWSLWVINAEDFI